MKNDKNKTTQAQTAYMINAPKYTSTGGVAGKYEKTTKAIAEYAGKEYGYEMKVLVLEGQETVYTEPTLSDRPTKREELAWDKKYDMYLRKADQYDEHKAKVFATVFGHCDESMKNTL